MTEQPFTASNGIVVTINDKGYLLGTRGDGEPGLHATGGPEYGVQALREFFQHERDTELGRARWPEDPDYVIYRVEENDDQDGRCVQVLHEPRAIATTTWERCTVEPISKRDLAARWYFTEGPGKKPERPWEEAQAGEVWLITVTGREVIAVASRTSFRHSFDQDDVGYFIAIRSTAITAGRKLLNADGSMADE